MINRAGLAIACALGAAGLYGLVPNFVSGAIGNGIPAIESTLFRTFLIAIVFSVIAVVRGDRLMVPRRALPSFAGQSIATLFVSVAYLGSVQFIPVGLAVIIFYLFPVLIMLLAPLVEGRNPGLLRILIAVVAFAGLAIAVGPGFDSLDIRGILLAAAGAAGATLQFFSGRSISRYMTPAAFGSMVHMVILPPVLAIALYAGSGTLRFLPGGPATGAGFLFMCGVAIVYIVAYMWQMLSLRFAPASTVAPYYNLEPVVATAAAAVILDEKLQLNQYAGGGLVLAALVAASLLGRWKK
ncbi:MAG: DMT family transporter [Aestuariivirga sp.]|uniref:DMT family transporter n=1 Tax=Aestuariivirga sp. TaxID=2650926 RepID=UPI0025C41192|nr:DMT family transporter [Aestuariivirga sp.]MCA3561359.1 DMT family transporter [Aestuariivirga sp.]